MRRRAGGSGGLTETNHQRPFTPAAEALNGRASMIGFLALLVVEGKMGHALF